MKKVKTGILMIVFVSLLLTGCCISHDWQEATCTAPRTCSKCGKTEGEALAHTWEEATCAAPKTCSVCGATEGEALAHTWEEATCAAPKTCSVCGATEGEALAHTWTEANYQEPKTCSVCGTTEGDPLKAYLAEITLYDKADEVHDMEATCYDDRSKMTLTKVWFTNVKRFNSDDKHEAKDGYEWISVDIYSAVGDDNYNNYGNTIGGQFNSYYEDINTKDDGTFVLNWYGKDYEECFLEEELLINDSGVIRKEYAEKFGWSKYTATLALRQFIRVPKGFDGHVCGFYDRGKYEMTNNLDECNQVLFRIK